MGRWDVASKAPLPSRLSDASAWRDWINGEDPSHSAPASLPSAPSRVRPPLNAERWHSNAIRIYIARTGRDVVSELQQSYRTATSDSVREIFGTILQALGELELTETEVADAFTSQVPERLALAHKALVASLGDSAAHIPDAKAEAFVDRLIAAVVNSTPLWSDLMASPRGFSSDLLPGVHGASGRILFDSENIPETVRAKWAGQVVFISESEWDKRSLRDGGIFYRVDPVRVWGRFARVHMWLSERVSRATNETPAAYAAGAIYYLMELNGEWVVVARQSWIT